MSTVSPRYREHLTAPLRWWVQATMSVAVLWLALIVSTPAVVAWTSTGAAVAIVFGLLGYLGSAVVEITVDTGGEMGGERVLRAGPARIPTRLLGSPEPLDKETTRRVLGVEADARAFLVTRPYLKRAVRVPVLDPSDPAPYWLISSRRPERLAASLQGLGEVATAEREE